MRALLAVLLLMGICLPGFSAMAMETTDVLPKGIRRISLTAGSVGGLNQYYSDSGQLERIGDINTVSLDVKTVSVLDERINDLVTVLNDFGYSNLGDQLFFGNLGIDAKPDLNYVAPVFLYGITDKLTMGLGVPYFTYNSRAQITLSGPNYGAIRDQLESSAGVPAAEELDAAFNQLQRGAAEYLKGELVKNGYDPIASKSQTYVGDVQLITAYQLKKSPKQVHTAQVLVSLPTGPTPDPDDLTDVEIFGRTSIRPTYITAYNLSPRSYLIGSLSYQYFLPGSMTRRVPLNENDYLPPVDSKRILDEKIGDTWSATAGAAWKHSRDFKTTVAYSREEKAEDSYSQSNYGNSSLLERNTSRSADIGKVEFSYNTIEKYKAKKFPAPMTIAYELSAVLAGKNVENQTRHNLWLSLYF